MRIFEMLLSDTAEGLITLTIHYNLTIDRAIEIFLLIAAISLTYYTYRLVKQQKVMNEERVMPLFSIDNSDSGLIIDPKSGTMNRYGGVWVDIFVRENIAREIHGKVYFEDSQIDEFRSPTSVPKNREDPLLVHSTKVDSKNSLEFNRLDNVRTGNIFTIQVELKYESTLGGNYKSLHWLRMKKIDDHKAKRIESDMEYTEMPF